MNNKLEDFKNFVRKHPNLIGYVKNGETSWQGLYEIYDLYGESDDAWDIYFKRKDENIRENITNSNFKFSDIVNMAKKLDADKVQNGISSIQKAISLFSDLVIKKDNIPTSSYTPRPLYKSFED